MILLDRGGIKWRMHNSLAGWNSFTWSACVGIRQCLAEDKAGNLQ
jgi:hypothetical protein